MEPKEPLVTVKGPIDGNVFVVIGAVRNALSQAGFTAEAREFRSQALEQHSYDDVLALALKYADFDL